MSDLDTLIAHLLTTPVDRAYKVGAVPASPVSPYCVVSLDSGTPQSKRVSGGSSVLLRSLSVQMFGTSVAGVELMQAAADNAFRDTYLPISDAPFSERVIATPVARDPDGEVLLHTLHVYQFQEST